MGFSKCTVSVRGRPALRAIVESWEEAGARVVVVLGEDAKERAPMLEGTRTIVVQNPFPDRGQTSSLREGLLHVPADWDFAVQPVDHAFVRPETVRVLLSAWEARPADHDSLVPVHAGRRGHPAFFRHHLREAFLALADGEPAHRVIRDPARRTLEVPVDDPAVCKDFDRPEDLEGIEGRDER